MNPGLGFGEKKLAGLLTDPTAQTNQGIRQVTGRKKKRLDVY